MLVSAYASNRGWLFLELLEHFDGFSGVEGVEVRGTFDPLPEADCFICIRTDELDRSPDLSRTVVQVHDFWPHEGLEDAIMDSATGPIVFAHGNQADTVGVGVFSDRAYRGYLPQVLPIGARRAFTLRESMPERFTVGWVGRNMRAPDGRDQKRPHLLAEALRELRKDMEVDCLVLSPHEEIGEMMCSGDLDPSRTEWQRPDRGSRRTPSFDQLQRFYHSIDVLVVTSLPEPGPLSVFEALRCGVPVVIVGDGPQPACTGWLSPHRGGGVGPSLSSMLRDLSGRRKEMFSARHAYRRSMPYLQEDWIAANVRLAVEVAGG